MQLPLGDWTLMTNDLEQPSVNTSTPNMPQFGSVQGDWMFSLCLEKLLQFKQDSSIVADL